MLAAVLSLIVFAGADEPVITGSALLGFAAGWAMLAVLSARMTDPAAAVGVGSGCHAGSDRAGAC